MKTTLKLALAAACALGAGSALAQAQDGRWNCLVGGVEVQMTIAGDTATMAFANGERFTLKRDASRVRPFYTDGKAALRLSGGRPSSTQGPEWVRGGDASSVERCIPAP